MFSWRIALATAVVCVNANTAFGFEIACEILDAMTAALTETCSILGAFVGRTAAQSTAPAPQR